MCLVPTGCQGARPPPCPPQAAGYFALQCCALLRAAIGNLGAEGWGTNREENPGTSEPMAAWSQVSVRSHEAGLGGAATALPWLLHISAHPGNCCLSWGEGDKAAKAAGSA